MINTLFASIPNEIGITAILIFFVVSILPAILALCFYRKESSNARIAAAVVAFYFSFGGLAIVYLFLYFFREKQYE
jgi:hypothetical protein